MRSDRLKPVDRNRVCHVRWQTRFDKRLMQRGDSGSQPATAGAKLLVHVGVEEIARVAHVHLLSALSVHLGDFVGDGLDGAALLAE